MLVLVASKVAEAGAVKSELAASNPVVAMLVLAALKLVSAGAAILMLIAPKLAEPDTAIRLFLEASKLARAGAAELMLIALTLLYLRPAL